MMTTVVAWAAADAASSTAPSASLAMFMTVPPTQTRAENGVKSVPTSNTSTPSRRLSQPTTA